MRSRMSDWGSRAPGCTSAIYNLSWARERKTSAECLNYELSAETSKDRRSWLKNITKHVNSQQYTACSDPWDGKCDTHVLQAILGHLSVQIMLSCLIVMKCNRKCKSWSRRGLWLNFRHQLSCICQGRDISEHAGEVIVIWWCENLLHPWNFTS